MQGIAEKMMQVVNFRTRDFQGSIDIDNLLKVISMPQLSLVPAGPDYVIGLLNLAGTVIPVIDLSARLNVSKPDKYTINTPIIICKTNKGQLFGVIVDQVDNIARVTDDMMQNDVVESGMNQIVSAAIKYQNSISLLINANNLLDEDVVQELKLTK